MEDGIENNMCTIIKNDILDDEINEKYYIYICISNNYEEKKDYKIITNKSTAINISKQQNCYIEIFKYSYNFTYETTNNFYKDGKLIKTNI